MTLFSFYKSTVHLGLFQAHYTMHKVLTCFFAVQLPRKDFFQGKENEWIIDPLSLCVMVTQTPTANFMLHF